MASTQEDIGRATEADLAGILDLQSANQIARGGMLSAEFPRARIEAMMRGMPLIVARHAGRVTGFLMSTTRAMNADVPVIRAMFQAYEGAADAYVYGPICVGQEARGRGLAEAMFTGLRRLAPGREGVLFIRADNEPSLRAHRRMGMREVGGFELDAAHYLVFSYVG